MKTRNQILEEFINKYKDLPKQGSQEWLNQRKFTVGGSQIATLMGINKYENMRSFARSKSNFYSFKKEAPLWFGNLMEPCIEQYVEIEFGSKPIETGSLPCSFNKHLSYSPDGICVVKRQNLYSLSSKEEIEDAVVYSENIADNKDIIVLFEFKSPFMRKIIKGDIPKYYRPQPLLGMEIIDIAEISVFIECVFRFCSYKDLYNNKYSYYHYDKERLNGSAIMYSAMSLYYDEDELDFESKEEVDNIIMSLDNYRETTYGKGYVDEDISSISDRKLINKIMENVVDKKNIKVIYHNMYSNRKKDYEDFNHFKFNSYNNVLKFNSEKETIKKNIKDNGSKYIGCICYKLLDVNQIPIMKESILNEALTTKIKKTFELIEKMNNIEEEEEVAKFIKKNF